MDNYKIYLGDCLDTMRHMETHSVDVVFTSPPYNDTGTNGDSHQKYKDVEFRNDWYEWQCECIDEMLRLAKRQVMYNVQPIKSNKEDVYRLIGKYAKKIDQILIWYKPNGTTQGYPHRITASYEMVLILKGDNFDVLNINSEFYRNVIVKTSNSMRAYSDIHKAVMSKSFCDEIIREFTQDGDVILDPFMGLGTTGISSLEIGGGRSFIGIEIDNEYCEIAEKRIQNVCEQVTFEDMLLSNNEQITF